jgi:peptide deformylase
MIFPFPAPLTAMTRLDILAYPDARLRRKAAPVRAFDADLARLIGDLCDTLRASGGIGLAAPQVGVALQVLVVDSGGPGGAPQAYINPRIVAQHRYGMVEESCLSLPGLVDSVRRPIALRVQACDAQGRAFAREADGMLAVCLHHEIDHLQGRLFLDRLPWYRRPGARRRLGAAMHERRLALGSTAAASSSAGRPARPGDGVPPQPFQPAEATR